jgi:hypothetical protein
MNQGKIFGVFINGGFMKNLFAVMFVCLFLLTTAFTEYLAAQETYESGARALIPKLMVNGTGSFVFIPYTQDKNGSDAGTNEYAYTTLTLAGVTAFYGMNATLGVSTDPSLNYGRPGGIFFPNQGVVITDNVSFGTSLWVKPIKMLKIQAGYFGDYTLAGKLLFSPYWFHQYVTDFLYYGDLFTPFGDDHQNVTVSLTPIENLFIAGSVPTKFIPGTDSLDGSSAKDTWEKIQAGAGYLIDGIGHVRAQYIGRNKTTEVAFALTAVDKLLIDLGGKFAIDDTGRSTIGGDVGVGLGVSFNTGNLSINALAFFANGYDIDEVKHDPAFTFNPWISYTFDRIGMVGIDANIYTKDGKTSPMSTLNDTETINEAGVSLAVFFERSLAPGTGCKLSVCYDTSTEKLTFPLALSIVF